MDYGGGFDESDSSRLGLADRAQLPFGDALGAVARDAWLHNPVNEFLDWQKLQSAESAGSGGPLSVMEWRRLQAEMPSSPTLQDPKDLNKQYGPLGLKFDRPMTQPAVDLMVGRKREELALSAAISRAPEGPGFKVASFLTSLAVSAADPLNVASAFIPVVGESRYALWAARYGKFAARFAKGTVEGATGAAVLEPLRYGNEQAYQGEYGAYDSFLNVAMGGLLGGGLHTGFGAVSDLLARAHPETREAALRTSVAQMAEGRAVDVEPVLASDPAIARAPERIAPEASRINDIVPTSAQEGIGSAPPPDAPIRFTTAKGSSYELHTDGTTTRDKAARPEHPGPNEQGPQPRSEATYFVDKADVEKLGLFQTEGPKKALVSDGKGNLGIKYLEGKDAGKIERSTVVPSEPVPRIGAVPVEVWQGGSRVHFGNEITAVEAAPPPVMSPAERQAHESTARALIQRSQGDTLAAAHGETPSPATSPQAAEAARVDVKEGIGDDIEEELGHAMDALKELEAQGVLDAGEIAQAQAAREGVTASARYEKAAKAAGWCLFLHP